MARTAKKGRSWLYFGLVLAAIAGLGAYLFPRLPQWRDRAAVAPETATTSIQPLSSQQNEELQAKAKGLELLLQQSPNNADALEGLVKVRLEQGDLKGSLTPLAKLAELNPQVPDYTILLAEGQQQLGDSEAAFAAYEKVLATNPSNIKALQGMVNLQLAQNRPEGAIGRLQDTLKVAAQANFAQPGSIDTVSIQLLLGQVYVRQDRLTEAIAVYDQAIEANPQDFRPLFAKAVVLQQQGLEVKAKPLLARAAALAPPKYKDQIKQMVAEPAAKSPTPAASPEQVPESPGAKAQSEANEKATDTP
jgi:tetratricopeptide (TPR) repeat protein